MFFSYGEIQAQQNFKYADSEACTAAAWSFGTHMASGDSTREYYYTNWYIDEFC